MIDLYYAPTPNGWKISIMLEELEMPYTVFPVNIRNGDQFKPEFLAISPNNRIPAIVDHAPMGGGEKLSMFETGAILLYLAEKSGRFMPADIRGRYAVMQWLMWQMGGLGPMLGQHGHFALYAAEKYPYAIARYRDEAARLYKVLDTQLGKTGAYVAGDEFTIADIAMIGPVRNLIGYYGARDLVEFDTLANVPAWLERALARPAVQRGVTIPAKPA